MKVHLYQKLKLTLLALLLVNLGFSQNVDLENLGGFVGKGKPLKINGALSANSVFFDSNQNTGRDPFTYVLQGNLNVSFMALSIPLNYSYTNQGTKLDYQLPYKINRLSMHPKYKWVQAHVGDATMSFSPYTLNGFQFTGGGLELTPKGNFKIAAMAGRLLKATEDSGNPNSIPSFSRFGYGLKVGYEKEKYSLGITSFYAKDQINSIAAVPDAKGVTPKENLALSVEGGYKLLDNLVLKATYASTALTQDLRATTTTGNRGGLAGNLFDNRASTQHFQAIKAGFDYNFKGSTLGVNYEHVDPGYATLGAYFFNNDFENTTLNTSTKLFKDKLSLAFNIGYQKDNLNKQKDQGTSRTVGAINASFDASDKLKFTGSYSNFSSFTNAKVNQFDAINNPDLGVNPSDLLDFKQVSQNANLNLNYLMSKSKEVQKSLNLNYSLTDVANAQGGIVRIGGASTFHNANTAYSMVFSKYDLNIMTALSATLNSIGRDEATTWGPTISISKKFFEKKFNASFATSYNSSKNQSVTTTITNIRANGSYTFKEKHIFNISAVQLFQSSPAAKNRSITITFGYNYSFDLGNFKLNKTPEKEKIR